LHYTAEQPWIKYRAYREGTITQTWDPLDVRGVSIIQLFSGTDIHRCLLCGECKYSSTSEIHLSATWWIYLGTLLFSTN